MHSDHSEYFLFAGRSRLEKSINSLLGIIEGISVDSIINKAEVDFLELWLNEHSELRDRHPYNELIPVVESAVADNVLSVEEKQDVLWLCERLRSAEFFDAVTADLQRLHAVLGGIAADGVVTEAELDGLSAWLADHGHLKTRWPYEEVASVITAVLADKKIDGHEQKLLSDFFGEFTAILDGRAVTSPKVLVEGNIIGLCAVCPEISFSGRSFCLTGTSYRYTRPEFSEKIKKLGGLVTNAVSGKLDYLIIGADGNPCWAYTCYGRKVEKAVELRKSGSRLLLVHENDLHDALADVNSVRG